MATLPDTLATRIFASDRRMAERIDVSIWTRLKLYGQPEHPARIANISASGFMAMTPCPVYDYAPIVVELPGIGWVKATVLWAMGDRIGGEFEELLDRDAMLKLEEFRL
jgi:PilZ domain